MTTLSLADWLNFSVASIEAEKTVIGLGPIESRQVVVAPVDGEEQSS